MINIVYIDRCDLNIVLDKSNNKGKCVSDLRMSKYTPHPPLSIYGKGNVQTIVVNIPTFALSIAEKTL